MGWSFLVTCEHASAALPEGVELGVAPHVLETHVSYDRGAREIACALAPELGAPLHLGRYSRLLVDLNRREHNPAAIVAESYGIAVPMNATLDEGARAARLATFHRPYRDAARDDARRLAASGGCLHLSVHSFDPSLDPARRAFDAGVLFDPSREPERTIARSIAEGLAARGDSVRENEPYRGTPEGLTSWLRDQLPAERYVGLEIEACHRWMHTPHSLVAFALRLSSAGREAAETSAPPTG
jgi:predicted N-formylglutamate amidohydrolase